MVKKNFIQIIAEGIVGDEYINTTTGDRLFIGITDIVITPKNKSTYISRSSCEWAKVEKEESYYIITVEHAVNGKGYEFIVDTDKQILARFAVGDFVVCDTKFGETYAKIREVERVMMKPSLAKKYKTILRYA